MHEKKQKYSAATNIDLLIPHDRHKPKSELVVFSKLEYVFEAIFRVTPATLPQLCSFSCTK